ncbi:MAG TPA: divergent polysaccharide deacetylase family protein [Gammaproteobacteria bacterium]|nr:divergent polysaccharide deacetylase family protein [Gammaproteobacteria bacterium]
MPDVGQPAAPIPASSPSVAIIIDDLGYSLRQGRRAIGLPGAVTCSILPGTPHAHILAQQATEAGKEIMLHLPMQGIDTSHIETDSLSPDMTEPVFRDVLRRQLAAIPEAAGVNNHMGSTLTPLPEQMNWLMDELSQHALYFVDSRTTALTVGAAAAQQHHVPFTQRDVFLDNDKDPAAIEQAFNKLLRKARKHGHAVGIAHAHPVTLAALELLLPKLAEQGIVLEPVSKLLPRQEVPNLTAQNQGAAATSPPSTP